MACAAMPRDVLKIPREWEEFKKETELSNQELIFVRSHSPWLLHEDVVESLAYELEEALRAHRWEEAASYLSVLIQSDVEKHIRTLMMYEVGPVLQLAMSATRLSKTREAAFVAKLAEGVSIRIVSYLEVLRRADLLEICGSA